MLYIIRTVCQSLGKGYISHSIIGRQLFDLVCDKLESECEDRLFILDDISKMMLEFRKPLNTCVVQEDDPNWLYLTGKVQSLLLQQYIKDHVNIACGQI
jgi:hypothetical protein